uniref:Zinc finger homeobox protein 3 n=1 Tax=Cacopsylla melanoneura TaxID=428564 RepID=A0A8D9DYT0_9HEMI
MEIQGSLPRTILNSKEVYSTRYLRIQNDASLRYRHTRLSGLTNIGLTACKNKHWQKQRQQQQREQQQQQQHHQTQQQQNQQSQDLMSPQNNEEINSSNPSSPLPLLTMLQQNNKIKQHEEFDYFSDSNCGDLPKDKRLRTTILPEQLDYLYQKYQIESNPSRKMLETIAKEVNLKKRVVQVWFQNTRARERKGQFRAHSQVINKRCPFCPALFKVKSAFESHLSTKHAEQCSKGEINIDAIPDEELSMDSAPSIASSNEASFKSFNSSMPPVFNNANDMDSLKKYYEESMKRYLSEIQLNGTKELTPEIIAKLKSDTNLPREGTTTPLDLSKPFDGMGGFNEFEDDENDDSLSECSDDEILPNSPKNQINNVQMKILSCLYESYKNPNIIEIEALSREMNINKKIIQIWYENTRIKDSKNNVNAIINECNICNVKYNNKYKIQDHIFTKKHIDNLKIFLDKSPNTQILPEIINNNNNNNQQEIAQLQLLQMASNLGISPQSLAIAVSKLDSKDQSAMTNEDLSIVQQLYGLTSNNMNPTNQQQLLSSNGY